MSSQNKLSLVVLVGLLATGSAVTSSRIYLLAVGHDYGSHEYFDGAGYLQGFGIALDDLVCREAGIDCRLVWDRYPNCWNSQPGQHATGGRGLHEGWYDVCAGWYTTVERVHVFQFSQPYLKPTPVHFFVLKGKTFETSNDSIRKSKLVFLESWATDEKCVARETGVIKSSTDIVYAKSIQDAIDYLSKGYDAIFTSLATLKAEHMEGNLAIAGDAEYSCMLAGNAMMTRKDNDFNVYWNQGFAKMKNSGRFKKYCETANAEHVAKGVVTCIDS